MRYPLGFDGETYSAGTVVRVLQHLRLPDNTFRVVLQGEYRGLIASIQKKGGFSTVSIEPMAAAETAAETGQENRTRLQALVRTAQRSFASTRSIQAGSTPKRLWRWKSRKAPNGWATSSATP
jgi:ATP-dependent Lon protease